MGCCGGNKMKSSSVVAAVAAAATESVMDSFPVRGPYLQAVKTAAVEAVSATVDAFAQQTGAAMPVVKEALQTVAALTEKPECKIQMLLNWYTTDACFMASSWQIENAAGMAFFLLHLFVVCVLLEFLRKMQREYDRKIAQAYREREGVVCLARERMGKKDAEDKKGAQEGACECKVDAKEKDGKCKCTKGTGSSSEEGSKKSCACPGSPKAPPSSPASTDSEAQAPGVQRERGAEKWVYTFKRKGFPSPWEQLVRTFIYCLQFGIAYYIMLMAMYYNGYIFMMLGFGIFTGHYLFGADNVTTGAKQETGTSCC